MLDLKLIRENPELVKEALKRRRLDFPFDKLLEVDRQRRKKVTEAQRLKTLRNKVTKEIADLKKKGKDVNEKLNEIKKISDKITILDNEIRKLNEKLKQLMLQLPNIPHESVPDGEDENDNVVIRKWGKPKEFSFKPRDHIELGELLGLIDIERAGKTSGSRFYFLREELVKLNYALICFAIDFIKKKGYNLLQPPYFLKREAIEGAIIFSDFQDMIYKVEDEDLYLIGTAEHAIAAMHMKEIFNGNILPLRYAGVSPCFRKEAGAHGRDTKGIFRVHQFEKVEQFVFAKPEQSWDELELLINNAEEFYQLLNLPYRITLLCTGDLGKVSAKTYDLEVWLPGQNKYREVVSCSNCTDYQARRLRIMYREKPHEEAKLVHTLNSTLVATERTIIAIMENYQQRDGSILIPEVLQPYTGFKVIKREK
jgi:seryl-tRNA synthetase